MFSSITRFSAWRFGRHRSCIPPGRAEWTRRRFRSAAATTAPRNLTRLSHRDLRSSEATKITRPSETEILMFGIDANIGLRARRARQAAGGFVSNVAQSGLLRDREGQRVADQPPRLSARNYIACFAGQFEWAEPEICGARLHARGGDCLVATASADTSHRQTSMTRTASIASATRLHPAPPLLARKNGRNLSAPR